MEKLDKDIKNAKALISNLRNEINKLKKD